MLDSGLPSQDIECLENLGSFDPNDKKGTPVGYRSEYLIDQNVPLEYLVRFQNTGTAPAHFVIIRDTISPFLDAASIRMGASSHPFLWKMEGLGNLEIYFEDINLVDSTTDAAASQGFVSFKIEQKKDVPLGSIIRNAALIYFDWNGAIQTNQTCHKIGKNFLEIVAVEGPTSGEIDGPTVKISPNPMSESALFEFEKMGAGRFHFLLHDEKGRAVKSQFFDGERFVFERKPVPNSLRGGLPSGAYFFNIENEKLVPNSLREGQKQLAGKLLLK